MNFVKLFISLLIISGITITQTAATASQNIAIDLPKPSISLESTKAKYYYQISEWTVQFYNAPKGSRIELQKNINNKWKKVVSEKPENWSGNDMLLYDSSDTRYPGYRALLIDKNNKVLITSKTVHAKIKKYNGQLINKYLAPEILQVKESKRLFEAWVSPVIGDETVSMQRYDSKTKQWVTVQSIKLTKESSGQTVRFNKVKAPNIKGKYDYRFQVSSKSHITKYSKTFKVNVLDQNKYKTYINKARKQMKKYCPAAPIYINAKEYGGARSLHSGSAHYPDMAINIKSGLNAKSLSYVSKHECAHLLQFAIYNDEIGINSTTQKHKKVSQKIFKGANWNEKEADCMTMAWVGIKKANFYGYKNTCTAAELKQAKKTIKLGKKYYDKWLKDSKR